jgi:hypothetical protein
MLPSNNEALQISVIECGFETFEELRTQRICSTAFMAIDINIEPTLGYSEICHGFESRALRSLVIESP